MLLIQDLDTSNLLDSVKLQSNQIESVNDIKHNISDSSVLYWDKAAWMVGERGRVRLPHLNSKL